MIGKDEKVHIAFVHADIVDAQFCFSMMDLCLKFTQRIGSINCFNGLGLLAKSRNVAVKNFLDNTTDDWLFFTDTDQFITLQAFDKLLMSIDKDKYPFVSALVFAGFRDGHELKPVPAIFKMTEDMGMQPYYDYPQDSLIEVFACGTGCFIIHRSVLEKLREDGTEQFGADWCWFQDGPIQGNMWLSEDLMFCYRAQSSGIKIHANTGALIPHKKEHWVTERDYSAWYDKNKENPYKNHHEISNLEIG